MMPIRPAPSSATLIGDASPRPPVPIAAQPAQCRGQDAAADGGALRRRSPALSCSTISQPS